MSWSSSISHPCYNPGLYDNTQNLSAVYGDTLLQFSHTHESNGEIRATVFGILQSKDSEEARVIISKMLNNVRRCCEYINNLNPEETASNSLLRRNIVQQHKEDEAIVTFLDTALVNLAIQKGVTQKAEQQKHQKDKNGCGVM